MARPSRRSRKNTTLATRPSIRPGYRHGTTLTLVGHYAHGWLHPGPTHKDGTGCIRVSEKKSSRQVDE
jgi:hypothetical protein